MHRPAEVRAASWRSAFFAWPCVFARENVARKDAKYAKRPQRSRARGFVLAIALLLSFSVRSLAQTPAKPAPGDAMIDKYLANETDRISKRYMDGATTLAEWEAKRPRLKQEYLDMLGLWPLPEKTPLHATITGTLERDDFVVDKLHFQSRPGLYVTGNLYRPKASRER